MEIKRPETFLDIARIVIEGDYDRYLRHDFVGKGREELLSGYLSGVRKSLAMLLYAAERGGWIKLTEVTRDLYISRSSAHKLLQRKLIKSGLVNVERRGKWMVYRLTPEGEKVVREIAEKLLKVWPEVEEMKRRKLEEERRKQMLLKRIREILKARQSTPEIVVKYVETDGEEEDEETLEATEAGEL